MEGCAGFAATPFIKGAIITPPAHAQYAYGHILCNCSYYSLEGCVRIVTSYALLHLWSSNYSTSQPFFLQHDIVEGCAGFAATTFIKGAIITSTVHAQYFSLYMLQLSMHIESQLNTTTIIAKPVWNSSKNREAHKHPKTHTPKNGSLRKREHLLGWWNRQAR